MAETATSQTSKRKKSSVDELVKLICELEQARFEGALTKAEQDMLDALMTIFEATSDTKPAVRRKIIKACLTLVALAAEPTQTQPTESRAFEPPTGEEASQDPRSAFVSESQEVADMSEDATAALTGASK